jgi:5-methylcytosine-specific restriction endonuclease McrA
MAERNAAYRGHWAKVSKLVIARDRGICHICNLPGADTADHLDPVSRHGPGIPALDRLAAAHRSCNSRRARELERAQREANPKRWPTRPALVTGKPGHRVWWGAIQPQDPAPYPRDDPGSPRRTA